MVPVRFWFGFALIAAFLAATACGGDPPDKEMKQAQDAIVAAETAGADQYAHEEFTAAQDALTRAHGAVSERDYRLALNHALDSRDRARHAVKDATDQKAIARADADRALTATDAAIAEVKVKLKAAEHAHVPSRLLRDARRTVADGEQRVQEARTAFDRGNYRDVAGALTPSTARLAGTARDLETATRSASRRRR